MIGLNLFEAFHQAVERTARKIVAVKGNQAALSGDQSRACVEVERGWRVDPDLIEFIFQIEQGIAQFVDLLAALELAVQLVKIGAGWHQEEIFPGSLANIVCEGRRTQAELQRRFEKLGGAGPGFICRIS